MRNWFIRFWNLKLQSVI